MADQPTARNIKRRRSPHHRVVYSNQTGTITTNVDIRLQFACIEEVNGKDWVVEDQVDVILGPLEAKGLYELLARQIPKMNLKVEVVKGDDKKAE